MRIRYLGHACLPIELDNVSHLRPQTLLREAIALIGSWPACGAYVYANHVLAINQSGEHLDLREADRFLAHCRTRGTDGERPFAMKELALPAA